MALGRKSVRMIYLTDIIYSFDAEYSGFQFLNDIWWLVAFLNDLEEKLNVSNLNLQVANKIVFHRQVRTEGQES